MAKREKRGLGRGLSALMADIDQGHGRGDDQSPRRAEMVVPIESVHPNPDQPRRAFSRDALDELADSIREKGVIQPLIVRADPNEPGTYQIVAGERRWRASQIAQRHDIPVIVRDFTDTEVLEVAIIENIQRADLNPVEEAMGYRQLMDRFGHTQERLAAAMGKSRPHIANVLRLLNLPEDVLDALRDGKITAGHARPLIGRDDAADLCRQVIARNLSVRDVEALTRKGTTGAAKGTTKPKPVTQEKDADTRAIEAELSAQLKMGVAIEHDVAGDGTGRLVLHYRDLEQLDDLLRLLSGGR